MDETIVKIGNLVIEINQEEQIVRILVNGKCVKFFAKDDCIQTSVLPNTCEDIINEFRNVFSII